MSTFAEYAVSALLLVGGAFTLIGAIGLARLPDFYTRLHGPTKATTVGVGAWSSSPPRSPPPIVQRLIWTLLAARDASW